MSLRGFYDRVEFWPGEIGQWGVRRTTHIGFEVRDRSGRHGFPTTSPLVAKTRFGTSYHFMVVEFEMGRRAQWVFTTEVGQPHTYGRLLVADPPGVVNKWVDTSGRGMDSDSDGCDT